MSLKSWVYQKGALMVLKRLWGFIDGNKSYIGGTAFILTGLGQMITTYLANQTIDQDGWTKIMAGWGIIAAKSAVGKIGQPVEPKP